MKIKNMMLFAIAGIAVILFLIYELSLSGMIFQTVGIFIFIGLSALVIKILSNREQTEEDSMIRAEKYAIRFIKERTGADVSYIDEEGATRTFTDVDNKISVFFAFKKKRLEGMRPIFYLVIIVKPENKPLKLFRFLENPEKYKLDDVFGINANWSIVIGDPKFAKSYGAPVKTREELYRQKPASGQTINVGIPDKSEDAEEKERLGLKR